MQRRHSALLVALITVGAAVAPTTSSGVFAEEPAPIGTPARVATPASIAVLGDSISAATGTGTLGGETPNNSWSTGNNTAVNSTYRRLLAINPPVLNNRYNMAGNGRQMIDMAGQAAAMPATTEYVQVQLGGNDLCTSSLAGMTSVEDYRAQFVAGLAAISTRNPDALVSVQSIPDIFNLWYIRYAPTSYNGQQSSQAGAARTFVDLGVIPCQSLLANPASTTETDMARRFAVRERNIEFNAVLAEECNKVLRCRFDNGATFDFSSNRDTDGNLLPRAAWTFTDLDISRNTGFLCPITGFFSPGCGDHFHPSLAGQAKLAAVAWDAAYGWSDDTAPTLTTSIDPAPNAAGWNNTAVTVSADSLDEVGVRGIEYRTHGPDGAVSGWNPVVGGTADVAVSVDGTSHVEFRALDVNGNLSASEFVTVHLDQVAPTIQIATPADGDIVTLGEAVAADFGCDDDRSGVAACDGTVGNSEGIDTATVGDKEFTVDALDNAGNTSTTTHLYSVHYVWSGFGAPLANGPKTVRGSGAVPVKFGLSDINGVAQPDANALVFMIGPDGVEIPAARVGPGGNVPTWDAVEGQFVFPLSTSGLARGEWTFVVRPGDGSAHTTTLILG